MINKINENNLNYINELSEYKIDLVSNPFNESYFIEENNEIIGFIEYAVMYDKAELNYIYIKNEYRQKGYAQRLFDFMWKNIKDICENITLEVNIENKKAINFYKKNGFEIVAIREKYYKNSDGYLMMKVVK